jgi:cytochrome c oxidase subunit 2
MDRRLARPFSAIALLTVTAILAGCTPEPATIEGARVRWLYDLFMVAAAGVFVIVAGLISWSVLRHRARGNDDAPPQTRDNPPLEIAWWALPTLLVIGLFVLTAQVLAQVDERTDDPAVTVDVTGFQWQWRFAIEGTDVVVTGESDEAPRILLPVGERIAFNLDSPDVVHSFWVPEFLIKRDVVPGLTNRIELTIEREGIYRAQCGEFCGLLHARMLFSIEAVSRDAYETWLAEQAP